MCPMCKAPVQSGCLGERTGLVSVPIPPRSFPAQAQANSVWYYMCFDFFFSKYVHFCTVWLITIILYGQLLCISQVVEGNMFHFLECSRPCKPLVKFILCIRVSFHWWGRACSVEATLVVKMLAFFQHIFMF